MSNETYETTTNWAQAKASGTPELARQVGLNAKQDAADERSSTGVGSSPADGKTSQTSAAVDQLERDASRKTDEAVREGQKDVREMQAAGAEYLNSAIETAKGNLPGSGEPAHEEDEK